MAVFRCKMCGGQLNIEEGMTVCECEYCGTKQTLPKSDNEQNLNMVNRANHYRQACEFDKAADIYEKLVAKEPNDAELYWSLVLCRYGIEYVDDPLTKKKIPTCHRTQFRSILEDPDYLSTIENADMFQKPVYEAEVKYIDGIQKGILEISNKEKPFDVFICYKETDDNGQRTHDSVLAQELYYQLVREGFKVFFSRITLEGKLGTQYEPYIFAALTSSKVMVVVGTKPEYFNAVWVKNEWSRFLSFMQDDRSKAIIPAYKDMDPYDLPDELSMFQAQDMSKLGFMQDLVHGINKILDKGKENTTKVKEVVVQNSVSNTQTEPLKKRIKIFLQDKDFESAKEYCNRVLDIDPEDWETYLYLACVDLKVSSFEFHTAEYGISGNKNYQKALRFADKNGKEKLEKINNDIIDRYKLNVYNSALYVMNNAKGVTDFEKAKQIFESLGNFKDSAKKADLCTEIIYKAAEEAMNNAVNENDFKYAADCFSKIKEYKDSAKKAEACLQKAEEARKGTIYSYAVSVKDIQPENAIQQLQTILDYKDSKQVIEKIKKDEEAKKEAERLRQEKAWQEAEKEIKRRARKRRITAIVTCVVLAVAVVLGIVTTQVILPAIRYNNEIKEISSSSKGDIVSFGKYDWYVMDKTEDGVQLLCNEIVDKRLYNDEWQDITWEDCTLRKWLNNDFYNQFSDDEKKLIIKTKVKNDDNSEYGTKGGNDTKDYIYLLSINETNKLPKDVLKNNASWWLRSPGYGQTTAAFVYSVGSVNSYGYYVYDSNYIYGVRPALNLQI